MTVRRGSCCSDSSLPLVWFDPPSGLFCVLRSARRRISAASKFQRRSTHPSRRNREARRPACRFAPRRAQDSESVDGRGYAVARRDWRNAGRPGSHQSRDTAHGTRSGEVLENLSRRPPIHPHFEKRLAFLGRTATRRGRCPVHVSRLPRRQRPRAAARFVDCRRKTDYGSQTGCVDSRISTGEDLRGGRKALRWDGHFAAALARKNLPGWKARAVLDALHAAESVGRAGPLSPERVCTRTEIGFGAQSLLLEIRRERKSAALPGCVGLSLCVK